MSRRGELLKRLGFAAVLTLIVGFFWMPTQVSSPNERSRVYLAHAMATRGQITVTPEWQRWGKVFDIAHRDGEFYSDKAPGSSALAVPIMAVSSKLNPQVGVEALVQRARSGLLLPFVFLGSLALLSLLSSLGVSARSARLSALALGAGSNVLHYGHAYFGHVLVLSCVLLALWALSRSLLSGAGAQAAVPAERDKASQDAPPAYAKHLYGALAGVFCGLCFAIEYQAALVSLCLGAGLLLDRQTRHWRHWLAMALGALPVVLLVLLYNKAAFGSPFATSYDHLYWKFSKELHDAGVGGVGVPTIEAIVGLIASPSRGLLFCAPWMLGALAAWHSRAPRWLKASAIMMSAAFFYVAAGFGMWSAGWGTGPRLLIPAFGAVTVLVAFGLDLLLERARVREHAALTALILCAILANVLLAGSFPENPEQFLVPVRDIALPLWRHGELSPNIISALFGAPRWLGGLIFLPLLGLIFVSARRPTAGLSAALIASLVWWGMMWSYPADQVTSKDPSKHVEWVKKLHKPKPAK